MSTDPIVRVEFPPELAAAVRAAIAEHRTGGDAVADGPLDASEPFVVEAPASVVLALLGAAYIAVREQVASRGEMPADEVAPLVAQVDWLARKRTAVERARDAA